MSEEFERNIALMEAHMAEAERCYLEAIPDTTAQRAFSYAYRCAWNRQQAKLDAKDKEADELYELNEKLSELLTGDKE
jgi:hypothetical protein